MIDYLFGGVQPNTGNEITMMTLPRLTLSHLHSLNGCCSTRRSPSQGHPQSGNRPTSKTHNLSPWRGCASVPPRRSVIYLHSLVYLISWRYVDPPLANFPSTSARSFLGEQSSNMPTPRRSSASPSPAPPPKQTPSRTTPSRNANLFEGANGIGPDPSVWLPEQQQQFMQALMNASGAPFPQSSPIGEPSMPLDPSLPPMDNPFAALLGPQAGAGAGAGMFPPFGPGMAGKLPGAMEEAKPKTKLQKALPLLHLIAMWCLLAYFVLWAEPKAYSEATGEDVRMSAVGLFKRWSALGTQSPLLSNANQIFRIHIVVSSNSPYY